jgi:ankyrin repeat protein
MKESRMRKSSAEMLVGIVIALIATAACQRDSAHSALLDAAGSGNLTKVKHLIEQGAFIDQPNPRKGDWTALIAAVFHNQTNVVSYLIESGADINQPDRNGDTPLMWAITHGDRAVFLVQYLIDNGADVLATNKAGNTALDYARALPARPRTLVVIEEAWKERTTRSD